MTSNACLVSQNEWKSLGFLQMGELNASKTFKVCYSKPSSSSACQRKLQESAWIRVVTFLGCSRRQCKKFRYFWWYFQTSLLVNNEPGPQSMSHLNLNVPCNRFVFLKADVWYRGPRSKLSSSKLSSSRATGHEQRSSFAGCPKCGTGMFLVFLFTKDDLPTGWHIPIYFPYFSFDYVGDW